MSSKTDIRILIVDDRREVSRVLRTSLELLNRGYLITDVPSGEEAMLEIQRVQFDLLIADYKLPGMTGAELIRRARKKTPGLQAIVITGHLTPKVESELNEVDILGIFEKPLDIEGFTNRVDEFLLGDQVIAGDGVHIKDEDLPPSEFDILAAAREIATLSAALGSEAAALVNRAGRIVSKDGNFSQAMCFPEIAVLLANNFTTTSEISTYIGEQPPSAMQYFANNWHDIYALTVSTDFFLVLVFPGGSQKQMGAVMRIGKPAAVRIGQLIYGEKAAEIVPDAEPSQAPPPVEEAPRMSLAQEIRMKKRAEEEARLQAELEETPPPPVFAELLEDNQADAPIDLDFDELDADLGNLEDMDSLWNESEIEASGTGSDALSIDEAIELGLISEDLSE